MSCNKKSVLYPGIIIISWIIILAVPSLRDMFLAQSVRGGFAILDSNVYPNEIILPAVIPHPKPLFWKLSKQFPASLPLKLCAIANETPPRQFIHQFPQSPAALAYVLNNYFSQMRGIRRAGALEDIHSVENQKKGIASTEREGKRDYTMQQWRHVIDLCKRGQRLAPQNAYFDVIEAYWQFEEFHDAAAWAAIARAKWKKTFDTYELDYALGNVQAYKIAYGRPLYWEEIEEQLASRAEFSVGFNVSMRELGRLIEWEGIKAQKRGDNKTAIRIYTQSFDVMHLQYQSAPSLFPKLMASALESMIISGPREAGIKPDKNTKQRAASLSAFKNYALSIHRPDLLRYVQIDKADYQTLFTLNDSVQNNQKQYMSSAFIGFLSWRIGVLLLQLLIGSVFIWLLSLLLTKVLLRQVVQDKVIFSAKDYWRGAISFVALPASLILLLCYAFSFGYQMITRTPDIYDMMGGFQIFSDFHTSLWWITLGGIATAILFSIAFALRRVAALHRKSDAPKVLLWKKILGSIGSMLFVLCWAGFISGKFPLSLNSPSVSQVINAILFGTDTGSDSRMVFILSAAIVVIGLLIYLYNTVHCWQQVDDWRSAFHDFWHLLCGSALHWVALASVLYLLTLAIAIPVRAPLYRRAMIKVVQGDLAVLKMGR